MMLRDEGIEILLFGVASGPLLKSERTGITLTRKASWGVGSGGGVLLDINVLAKLVIGLEWFLLRNARYDTA